MNTGTPQRPEPGPTRRASTAAGRATRRTGKMVARKVDALFSEKGPGFRALAVSHVTAAAGDAMLTVALADTLFLTPDPSEARSNVVLYLLLTLAPFAVLAPVLTSLFVRFPIAYRRGLGVSSGVRAVLAFIMASQFDSLLLFPLAFGMLVFSRIHGISRNSLIPVALDEPGELVAANARMAKIGVLGGVVAAPLAAGIDRLLDPSAVLLVAMVVFALSTLAASGVPFPTTAVAEGPVRRKLFVVPRPMRLAEAATGMVRFLNGFLLFLLAFAFRDQEAGLADFGVLLGAAGLGYFVGAVIAAWLERHLREEPMVVGALALEAAAAFIAGQWFGLGLAAALAGAAGLAWGVAKLGFDGLLQRVVSDENRGRAFVRAETVFQLAWVVGAVIPVAITIPTKVGLALAGVAALAAQVVYVAGLIAPGQAPSLAQDESLPRDR